MILREKDLGRDLEENEAIFMLSGWEEVSVI